MSDRRSRITDATVAYLAGDITGQEMQELVQMAEQETPEADEITARWYRYLDERDEQDTDLTKYLRTGCQLCRRIGHPFTEPCLR